MANTAAEKPRLAIAILAAGAGSRFGSIKALARFREQSLLERALTAISAIPETSAYVVLGAHADTILAAIEPGHAKVVHNPDWQKGMASSIGMAVSAARSQCDGLLLLAVDQPLITTRHLQTLVNAWYQAPDHMVAAFYDGKAGIPALFPARCFDRLLALQGDRGASQLLADDRDPPVTVELPEAAFDADTPEALAALES